MRAAYLSQAYEFGRCPSQAFTEPHPPKQTTAAAAAGGLGTAEPATMTATGLGQGDDGNGGGDGDVVMAVVAPNDAESAGSEPGKPEREGETNAAAASADTTAGADVSGQD